MKSKIEKFYLEKDGAFSYYPGSKEATVEGTGDMLGFLDIIGALSEEKQRLLWGSPDKCITDLGEYQVAELQESNLAMLKDSQGLNSLRIFSTDPGSGNFTSGIVCLYYPQTTSVLDIVDLLPKMKRWLNSTSQNMGNWTSKEIVLQKLEAVPIEQVPVNNEKIPLDVLNGVLQKNRELTMIGFDVLQMPKYKIKFRLSKGY